MKTLTLKQKQIKRDWKVIDLKEKVLGRVAVEIAKYLTGKHKPTYSPHLDQGDYVVAINASNLILTGKKTEQKVYRHHTGRPGGFREIPFKQMFSNNPNEVVIHAVKGMLPKNKLRDPRLKRLKVFTNSDHPYQVELTDKNNG